MHLTIDHTWIGIGALIGAAASAVVYAADFLMLGKPRLSRTFSSIGVITQINDTRLYWGCVLGVLFIPVMIFGVVAVAAQFVAHSIAAALFVLVTWTLFLALGSAVHNGFGYLGQVAKAKSHFGDSAIPPCFSAAEREQTRYFKADRKSVV